MDNSSVDAVLSVDDADSAGDVSLVETVDSTLDELSSEGDVSVTTSAESSSDDSTGSSDSESLAANVTATNSSIRASTITDNKKATKLTAKSYTYKYARKTLTLKAKLVNYQGKALSRKKIKLRLNCKNYYAKTGSN